MGRPRYDYKTKLIEFTHDVDFTTLLDKYGIFTVGGLITTPMRNFIETEELFKSYDKYVFHVLRIHQLVQYGNFTV